MKRSSKIFFLEVGLIFLLWLAGIWVSHPYFNRPLEAHQEWETAHVLVSMRAYDEWGFWKVMGASVLLPHTKEWRDTDIAKKGVEINKILPAVYLSLPSWNFIFPYAARKLLNIVPFVNIPLSALFLESYNLVVSRLFTGIIFYYLFLEIIKLFIAEDEGIFRQKALAFIGTAAWMLDPAVLYFTQNTYFGEKSYFGFVYAIILLSLKCGFRFEALSKGEKLLLFILSFIACGTSYFGWFTVIFLCFAAFAYRFLSMRTFAVDRSFSRYLKSILPIAVGAFTAAMTFLVQLLYFKNGFSLLHERFVERLGLSDFAESAKVPFSYSYAFGKIVSYWDNYLPLGTTYRHELFIGIMVLLFGMIGFFLVAARSRDRIYTILLFCLIYLMPVCYVFLLKEWAYMHDFSGQTISFPLILSWAILPVLLLSRWKFTDQAIIILALLVLAVATQSRSLSVNFAEKGSDIYEALGKIVTRNAGMNDIVIIPPQHAITEANLGSSHNIADITILLNSPLMLWYSDRYIYRIEILRKLLLNGTLARDKIMKMDRVFIAFNPNEKLDEKLSEILRKKGLEEEVTFDRIPVYLYHGPRE